MLYEKDVQTSITDYSTVEAPSETIVCYLVAGETQGSPSEILEIALSLNDVLELFEAVPLEHTHTCIKMLLRCLQWSFASLAMGKIKWL